MRKYEKLDYVAFEHIFAKYCKRNISVYKEGEWSSVPPTSENIDRYILLPAAMTDDEIRRTLWNDDWKIDKATLSRFRTSGRLQEQIVRCYQKSSALDMVYGYFDYILIDVLGKDLNKMYKLAIDINGVVSRDRTIPSKYKKIFFHLYEGKEILWFLTATFVFCVIRYEENLFKEDPVADPIMQRTLDDLAKYGKSLYLDDLLGDILTDIKPDSNDVRPFTKFSYEICSQFIIELKQYAEKLPISTLSLRDSVGISLVSYDRMILRQRGQEYSNDELCEKYGLEGFSFIEIDPSVECMSRKVDVCGAPGRLEIDNRGPEHIFKLTELDRDTLEPIAGGETRIIKRRSTRIEDTF